jgi:hypothetical protein
MGITDQTLESFFTEYEARTNRALRTSPSVDVEATAAAFTDYFLGANPLGVYCAKNDEEYRQQILKGFEFYRNIRTKSMAIKSLTMTPLDDYHSMVKVHWEAFYRKPDGLEDLIDFDVIYLVQMIDETPKIFAYITGDEQKVLREHGLIES